MKNCPRLPFTPCLILLCGWFFAPPLAADETLLIQFKRSEPVKLSGLIFSDYLPARYGYDADRLALAEKADPNQTNYALIDLRRFGVAQTMSSFELTVYRHGSTGPKWAEAIRIVSSPDGVNYTPAEFTTDQTLETYAGGWLKTRLWSGPAQAPFRYLRLELSGREKKWGLEFGALRLTAAALTEAPPLRTTVAPPAPAQPAAPPAETPGYAIPAGQPRGETLVPKLAVWPTPENDVDPAALDLPTLAWREAVLPDNYRSHSWSGYQEAKIPADTHCVLHRFAISGQVPAGQRLILRLEQSAFVTTVYVNGKEVQTFHEGFLPLECDLTDAARGQTDSEVMVKVRDHRAGRDAAGQPTMPLGAMYAYTSGIAGPLRLLTRPAVQLDEPFIISDVAAGTVTVRAKVRNLSAADFTGTLRYALNATDGRSIRSAEQAVIVPAGGTLTPEFVFTVGDELQRWDIGEPNLYFAAGELAAATPIDRLATRFGYRTVTVNGEDVQLNGRKIRLLGPWAHIGEWTWAACTKADQSSTPAEIFRLLLARGMNYGRLHCQPYGRIFYDSADETGFLLIAESGLAHRPIADESLRHVARMVKVLRNHPAIVIWSGSNEFEHWLVPRPQATMEFLVKVQEIIKANDPTRPVQHSGFGDALGQLDIYNLHYPEGTPPAEYPRGLYWKSRPESMANRLYPDNFAQYNPVGKKPLAIGEQLIPGTRLGLEAIYGDVIIRQTNSPYLADFLDYERYMGDMWRAAIRAYREQNISVISPNFFYMPDATDSVFLREIAPEGGPAGAYIREFDPALHAGVENARTLVVYEDSGRAWSGEVECRLQVGEATVWNWRERLELKPNEMREIPLSLPLPAGGDHTGELRCELFGLDGQSRYVSRREVKLYGPADLPSLNLNLLTWGVDSIPALAELDVKITPLAGPAALKDLAGGQILAIGPGCPDAALGEAAEALSAFVNQGGSVLLLARDSLPAVLPVETKLLAGNHPGATAGFVRAPSHPLFLGRNFVLENADFRFWSELDQRVAARALFKPTSGEFTCLVDAGENLDQVLLLEAPHGRGTYLLCQLAVLEALKTRPAARRLLYQTLVYLRDRRRETPPPSGHYLLPADAYARSVLDKAGWQPRPETAPARAERSCLWLDNEAAKTLGVEKCEQAAAGYRTVILHGLEDTLLAELSERLAGTAPAWRPWPEAGVTRLRDKRGRLGRSFRPVLAQPVLVELAGISSVDLDWFKDGQELDRELAPGNGWQTATNPGLLAVHSGGERTVIVDQTPWNMEVDFTERRQRFLHTFWTNLGLAVKGGRTVNNLAAEAAFVKVSLKAQCNASGADYLGPNLPTGETILAGVPFALLQASAVQAQTMIRLNARQGTPLEGQEVLADTPIDRFDLPTPPAVRIPCDRLHAQTVYFAQTCTQNWRIKAQATGRVVAVYKIAYADATEESVPLLIGEQIQDCRTERAPTRSCALGIKFANPRNGPGETASLYVFAWENPHPERKIVAITLESGRNPPYDPLLFAITVKEAKEKFF